MAWWTAVVSVLIPFVFVGLVLWLTCQRICCSVPVTSTNRLYKESKREVTLAAWQWHDASDLSTSPWFGSGGKAVVLTYRCFLLAVFVFVIILEFNTGGSTDSWATYFTNWTFVGLGVHAIFGMIQSIRGIRRGDQRPESSGWTLRPYGWLDASYAIVATTVITMSAHVSIFYWVALFPDKIYADSVFKHGINALLLQIELCLSSLPWTSTWVVFPSMYTLAYAIFMWIWQAADEIWVYSSLDYHKQSAPAMYIGVAVLVLFAFALSGLVAWVREKVARKVLPAPNTIPMTDGKVFENELELGTVQQ